MLPFGHTCHIFKWDIWQIVFIFVHMTSAASIMLPGTQYINFANCISGDLHISLNKYNSYIANIGDYPHTEKAHRPDIGAHMYQKHQKLQHVLHIILTYI